MRYAVRRSMRWSLAAGCLVLSAGCGFGLQASDGEADVAFLDAGDNETFTEAGALPRFSDGLLTFRGAIETPADVDVYALGELGPGDQLRVSVVAANDTLDAVAGVFDADENLWAFDDDRARATRDLDPLIEMTARAAPRNYFLAVTAYHGTRTTGAYEVTIERWRGTAEDAPTQIVYFNWAGGAQVTIPTFGTYPAIEFDAVDLGLPTERTEAVQIAIEDQVAARYDGFRIDFTTSRDGPPPEALHATIHFGGNNDIVFGLANGVDVANSRPEGEAIIFVGAFADEFRGASEDEFVTALANGVAHELGHLLGLSHTSSCDSLMDVSCENTRLLEPLAFIRAVLDARVFPIGFQNAIDYLTWVLGSVG